MRQILYILIPVLYIPNLFIHSIFINICLLLISVVAILLSLPKVQALYRWSSIAFVIIGFIIYFSQNIEFDYLLTAFHPMMGLLGIFIVLPFLQGILRLIKYDKSMKQLIRYRVSRLSGVYQRTSLFTYVLAVFLTIATLPISIQSLNKLVPALEDETKKKFYTHSMLRGYTMALFWSPVELLVIASIDGLNANYLILMPVLLIVSFIYLYLDWAVHRKKYNYPVGDLNIKVNQTFDKKHRVKIGQFLTALILFLLLILLTNMILGKGLLVSITLIVIPFSLCWILLLKKLPIYLAYMKRDLKVSIGNMYNFVALFLSAGFFISMAQRSVVYDYVSEVVTKQFQVLPLFVFYFLIAAIFWVLSLSGFHSVVTIALLAQILIPISSGIENSLALVFIGSSVALLMVSPFNVATAIMSTLIQATPMQIFKWNFKYALGLTTFVTVVAYLVTLI